MIKPSPVYSRKKVFSAACLGMMLFGIALITLGAIAPSLKEKFGLSDIASGVLFSILPLGVLAGSLLFGPLCDRHGYRVVLALSGLLMFAGFEGLAWCPAKELLNVFILLFGIGGGAINGATNAVVADISGGARGADLSLLGVFYGIGALGMPFVLGALKTIASFETIIAAVGFLSLLISLLFLVTRFPAPKQPNGFPLARSLALAKDKIILLIALFLFFESSLEAIISNWTTNYLTGYLRVGERPALFALSAFVAGMALMRLLNGSVLRNMPVRKLLFLLLGVAFVSCAVLLNTRSFGTAQAALFFLGAGLAACFPVMLGLVGERYAEVSATAFSFVLVISLIGNMGINYLVGVMAQHYGIKCLTTVEMAEVVILTGLCGYIFYSLRSAQST